MDVAGGWRLERGGRNTAQLYIPTYYLGGKKRDSGLKQHPLQKSADLEQIKMNTSTWSHFEDLTQTFEMGLI